MPIQWTSNPQKVWPAAANGVTLTPSGSAWTSGNYVELEASADEDSILTGVVVSAANSNNDQMEIDIATGAVASEVVIATVKGQQNGGPGASNNYVNVRWVFSIPVDAIAQGDRISARIRIGSTSVSTYLVAAQYYEKPIVGNLDISAQPVKVIPAAANAATPSSPASIPWSNGTWVQLTAATSAAWVIDGAMTFRSGNFDSEVDIGIGAAASETVITTLRCPGDGAGTGMCIYPITFPLDAIPNGSRVAVRARVSTTSATVGVSLSYREKPL